MPPCRTRGIVKPMKYERTHEENQERAYIAASRRSDRCLEARMESARRASAIHEKRTGRALRITEADVVNEAMYEEVNDLPSQYRRLNAHLQTRNAYFDRRLLAYLSSQIATRQALSDCWQGTESSNDAYLANPSMISHQTEPNDTHMSFDPPAQLSMHQQEQAYAASAESPFAFSLQQQHLHPIMTSSPSGPRPDGLARIDSAVDMTMSSSGFHHLNDPRSNCQPFQANNRLSPDPLSSALPLSSQQLLSGSQFQLRHPNEGGNFAGTRRYSYNPNGRPSTAPVSPTPPQYTMSTGLAQISSSPSPLWLDTLAGSSPSPTHSGPPLQLHHDSPGIATHRHSRKFSARTGS